MKTCPLRAQSSSSSSSSVDVDPPQRPVLASSSSRPLSDSFRTPGRPSTANNGFNDNSDSDSDSEPDDDDEAVVNSNILEAVETENAPTVFDLTTLEWEECEILEATPSKTRQGTPPISQEPGIPKFRKPTSYAGPKLARCKHLSPKELFCHFLMPQQCLLL